MSEQVNGVSMNLLQEENLRILGAFVEICKKHNIWYSLAYGTMLGAVRHNGMIPWDRDVDIYVQITDVPLIRDILDKELPPNCRYMKRGVTKGYSSSHELLESTRVTNAHLDIYPLVGAPSDPKLQESFTKRTYYLRKILKSKYVNIRHCLPKNRPMVLVAKVIDCFISDKRIEKIYSELENMYDYNSAEYVVSLANYGKASNCVKKEILMDTEEHVFENLQCSIPKEYDTYLTQIYGDYMTPKKY